MREKHRVLHRTNSHYSSLVIQVLDAGRIHAYDEPHTLLQDADGIFHKMVQQTGKQEAAALMQAAKQVSRQVSVAFIRLPPKQH